MGATSRLKAWTSVSLIRDHLRKEEGLALASSHYGSAYSSDQVGSLALELSGLQLVPIGTGAIRFTWKIVGARKAKLWSQDNSLITVLLEPPSTSAVRPSIWIDASTCS